MTGLVQESYFEAVIVAMKEKGFALFSRVTTEQDSDLRYHVDAKVARDTRLFFHYPNKCLIVVLVYREDDSWERDIEGYWSVQSYHELLPVEELVRAERVPEGIRPPREQYRIDDWGDRYYRIPFHNSSPDETRFSDFELKGWDLEQRTAPGSCRYEVLTPTRVAENVWGFVSGAIPFLNKGAFSELQVTSFPPLYAFKRCEKEFWQRFKEASGLISTPRYLWSLVRRPWGSEGLKQ